MIATALVAYIMAPGAAELLAVPVSPWARLAPPDGFRHEAGAAEVTP